MTTKPKWTYGLRTNDENNQAYKGFQYPTKGRVECLKWDPSPTCGNGLHFLAWGAGSAELLTHPDKDNWQVVRALTSEVVDLQGKANKAPWVEVVHQGNQLTATNYLAKKLPKGHTQPVHYGTATAGNYGTATAGNYGTATAGNYGTATAGHSGSTLAKYNGTATAGYNGTATAGNYGTATAGHSGTATAGYSGTATAGNYGTATAGYSGTATAGYYGTATAGHYGTLRIKYYARGRYRWAIAYVGEGGILPNTAYKVDGAGVFHVS
jgi:hypothetical protein